MHMCVTKNEFLCICVGLQSSILMLFFYDDKLNILLLVLLKIFLLIAPVFESILYVTSQIFVQTHYHHQVLQIQHVSCIKYTEVREQHRNVNLSSQLCAVINVHEYSVKCSSLCMSSVCMHIFHLSYHCNTSYVLTQEWHDDSY